MVHKHAFLNQIYDAGENKYSDPYKGGYKKKKEELRNALTEVFSEWKKYDAQV